MKQKKRDGKAGNVKKEMQEKQTGNKSAENREEENTQDGDWRSRNLKVKEGKIKTGSGIVERACKFTHTKSPLPPSIYLPYYFFCHIFTNFQ